MSEGVLPTYVPGDIVGIDPGTTQSGIVQLHAYEIRSAILPNIDVLAKLRDLPKPRKQYILVIEDMQNYGMHVGASIFGTLKFCGRIQEIAESKQLEVIWMPRKTVCTELCGTARAGGPSIRAALIDAFGGKEKAIGKKKNPGPLYGIKTHMWSALALAYYEATKQGIRFKTT